MYRKATCLSWNIDCYSNNDKYSHCYYADGVVNNYIHRGMWETYCIYDKYAVCYAKPSVAFYIKKQQIEAEIKNYIDKKIKI